MLQPRHALAVVATMIAFAANSILCRLALREPARIDPSTFTAVRLLSGMVMLALLVAARERRVQPAAGSWPAGFALFVYALAFSLAYVRLSAGVGALVLFASVQLTMFAAAMAHGERLAVLQWLGLGVAMTGLVLLTWRGVSAPDPLAAALMALAGAAWGAYSIRGRRSTRPLADTAGNFARGVPFALVASVISLRSFAPTREGLLLAVASGALASGLGYAIWYLALPSLRATTAAVVQLSVPLLTAAAGIALLGERGSVRLAWATLLILSGIAMAVLRRRTD